MSEVMRKQFQRICVFCGSNAGGRPEYVAQAQALGRALATRKIGLVYGGGGIGMMGAVAEGVLAAHGEVIGVIPYALAGKERAHPAVELRVVNTMHERKALMASLSDAFIALPGGFGTFEELFEMITWGQLGIHRKPIGVLNIAGYFDPLLAQVERSIEEGFILPRFRNLIVSATEVEELLERMSDWQPLESIVQWIEMSET